MYWAFFFICQRPFSFNEKIPFIRKLVLYYPYLSCIIYLRFILYFTRRVGLCLYNLYIARLVFYIVNNPLKYRSRKHLEHINWFCRFTFNKLIVKFKMVAKRKWEMWRCIYRFQFVDKPEQHNTVVKDIIFFIKRNLVFCLHRNWSAMG